MFKKQIVNPVKTAILGCVFMLISGLVWINRGKSIRLVKHKLFLGVLFLSMISTTSCVEQQRDETCYRTARHKDSISGDDSTSKQNVKDRTSDTDKNMRIMCYDTIAPPNNK